ncbi:MAG: hypothetical protein CVU59_01000 [Deltaproteobacteria bacterium HGW-Deltaproteobacteria-17]|nr:MAG: hypothetical protein CVU59_01000 [Deltaproteobacteria bacterium HGW-Deltaproteobacteria-17]
MIQLFLALSLLMTPSARGWPASWRVVLSRGPLPVLKEGRLVTSADSFIKWIVDDRCVISLGGDTAVIFKAALGSDCPGIHLVDGSIRIAAPADHPVELTWNEGRRAVRGVVSVSRVRGRVTFDGAGPVEPGVTVSLSAQPVWQQQARIHLLLRETFLRGNETPVQTSGSGSMCLDSGGSAGDVGHNQTGITQIPPEARLHLRVPYPRPVIP